MSTGDSDDMRRRLQSLVPPGWVQRTGPVYNAVLGGIGDTLAWSYSLLLFVRDQTRIKTASGWFLDLIAWDFLGTRVLRRENELDDAWRMRFVKEIFRPRVTRAAISDAITDLVGTPPQIFEPWNTDDCGAYDVGTLAYAGSLKATTLGGYDTNLGGYDCGLLAYVAPLPPDAVVGSSAGAGCYGSYELPNQMFIKIKRPPRTGVLDPEAAGYGFYDTPSMAYGGGVPLPLKYAGYDSSIAGLDVGPMNYSAPIAPFGPFPGVGSYAPEEFGGSNPVSDDEIYAAVAAQKAAGVTAWIGLDTP